MQIRPVINDIAIPNANIKALSIIKSIVPLSSNCKIAAPRTTGADR